MRRTLMTLLLLLGATPALAQVSQRSIRDCPDCPEMVPLPAGTYTMGVPRGEEEREGVPVDLRGRSEPQRRITIAAGLAMARNTVTRGEYAAFVAATGHRTTEGCWSFVNTGTSYEYEERPGLTWRAPGFQQADEHPAVCVSWEDANAYAAWVSARAGRTYRLPSEAEWEYAARAGTTTSRYWGEAQVAACEFANVADLTLAMALNLDRRPQFTFRCTDRHVFTAPVGSFRPNAFGLNDMLGNVWQWTADCLNPNLDGQLGDGSARTTGDCTSRGMRGGSWSHLPWYVRAGNRARGQAADRYGFGGFRLVRER
jgi:formylglycine-generating enzyme